MKILICGTRKKGYKDLVFQRLNDYTILNEEELEIVEGCCPDSADEYAEQWAKEKGIKIHHFPSTSGNYLKRNIEMVEMCDKIIAFWDEYSYGTAHTIAHGILNKKDIEIISLKVEKK